jgi:hypothetical protein
MVATVMIELATDPFPRRSAAPIRSKSMLSGSYRAAYLRVAVFPSSRWLWRPILASSAAITAGRTKTMVGRSPLPQRMAAMLTLDRQVLLNGQADPVPRKPTMPQAYRPRR